MKNSISLLMLLMTFSVCSGQKVMEASLSFDDVRLPLQPKENMTSYLFTVKTPYPTTTLNMSEMALRQHEEAVARYPETVAESKAQFERDLEQYERDCESARENFRLESEEFQKLSKLERLASEDKPTLNLPRKPYYIKPKEPVFVEPNQSKMIVFNPEMLSDNYLKLDGAGKGPGGIAGHVTLYDWEYLEPELKKEEKMVYNSKTKTKVKQMVYWYETSVKRPVNLYLEHNGTVLYDGLFERSGEYIVMETEKKPSMMNLEKESVENALLEVNDYINVNYGYTPYNTTFKVKYAKNKGGEYDDIDGAKDAVETGLDNYETGVTNNHLKEAIAVWEAVVEEYDPNVKKARINLKLAKAMHLNLINMAILQGDDDRFNKYYSSYKDLKLNYTEKQAIDGFKSSFKERNERLKANGL